MNSVTLRSPRLEEFPVLSRLCYRSKAVWGYDEAFMEACRSELTLTDSDLVSSSLRVAEDVTGVVGVAQVSVEGRDAFLEKLFVAPERFGDGIGGRLYRWAVDEARALGAVRLVVESDPDAAAFYEAMGAQRAGTAPSGSIPGRSLPRFVMTL